MWPIPDQNWGNHKGNAIGSFWYNWVKITSVEFLQTGKIHVLAGWTADFGRYALKQSWQLLGTNSQRKLSDTDLQRHLDHDRTCSKRDLTWGMPSDMVKEPQKKGKTNLFSKIMVFGARANFHEHDENTFFRDFMIQYLKNQWSDCFERNSFQISHTKLWIHLLMVSLGSLSVKWRGGPPCTNFGKFQP